MDSDRLRREASFHDHTFGEETRRNVTRYYAGAKSSKEFYRDYVEGHAAGSSVLEYGCGPYSQARHLVPRGASVVGIDISHVALLQRRSRLRRQGVDSEDSSVMNAEQLAFRDSSFDLVCGNGILHHLALRSCLGELARVTKPTGSAVFIEPLGHNPLINLFRRLTPSLRTVDEHPLLMDDLETGRLFFNSIQVHYFHLTSLAALPFVALPLGRHLATALDRLDQWLFRTLPALQRHAWACAIVLSQPKKKLRAVPARAMVARAS